MNEEDCREDGSAKDAFVGAAARTIDGEVAVIRGSINEYIYEHVIAQMQHVENIRLFRHMSWCCLGMRCAAPGPSS